MIWDTDKQAGVQRELGVSRESRSSLSLVISRPLVLLLRRQWYMSVLGLEGGVATLVRGGGCGWWTAVTSVS